MLGIEHPYASTVARALLCVASPPSSAEEILGESPAGLRLQVASETNLLHELITRLELDTLISQTAAELRLCFEPVPNSQPIQVIKKLAGFLTRWKLRFDGAEKLNRIGEAL
jgi:hypothetical protein